MTQELFISVREIATRKRESRAEQRKMAMGRKRRQAAEREREVSCHSDRREL